MNDPVVLCYHAVSDRWHAPLSVAPRQLDEQVRLLLRRGYRPATFADALLRPTSDKTFVVTFDDGFRSVLQLALPVLSRLHVPATLFVPTGLVGDERARADWPGLERPPAELADELDLMTWEEVGHLAGQGWEIGAHTITHPPLTTLDDTTLADELEVPRTTIERRLGRPCETIAYPFGDFDDRVVRAAMRAGYRAGAALPAVRSLYPRTPHTPMRFRRVGVYSADSRPRFEAKLAAARYASTGAGHAMPDPETPAPTPVAAADPAATPRVAVLIPCFNDGPLAHEAVASVIESEPIELVVIDDASTDPATHAALEELAARGVRVLRHEVNQGLSAARRTGLAATSAPYVFPLDSDDLLAPGAMGRLADRLDAAPDACAVWGDIVEFGTRDLYRRTPACLEGYRLAYLNEYPVCSLFRRSALEEVGAWQDVGGMVGYEDWNLWMSFAERDAAGYHAGPGTVAVRRRLHGPRMLGDSITRHRRLYDELRRTHPRLFAEMPRHRRASRLPAVRRITYPLLFGGRPPLGIRSRFWELSAAVRDRLNRRRR